MPKRTTSYRARLLESLIVPEEAAHYLSAALDDSPEIFLDAVKDVAQAHQMANVAKKSGVKRESIYRSFSKRGNPTLETLNSVLGALGLEFSEIRVKRASVSSTAEGSHHHLQSRPHKARRKASYRGRAEVFGQLRLPLRDALANGQSAGTSYAAPSIDLAKIKMLGQIRWQSGSGSTTGHPSQYVNQERSEVPLPNFTIMQANGTAAFSEQLAP
jgi:probable addiction module antidote protein